ncbi:SRPBCC family protein [Microlunatus parietis]|uniref:Activator of Hsp90 ATPase homologue 1/2-like C-terminal domain-containing protein n=1 Tax=Microlunatus parietis TaxID=682979 RepID=A0A7Y9IEU1_9ACTN|nr:SRPBCC domain-containing protein [Microlunatus parietis]NYE75626.1 hypothetical protein [Microlunatus parietis]
MMQADSASSYTEAFHVDRTPQVAFEAITNVRGWWSQGVQGVTDEVGAEFEYSFQDVHRSRIRVTELVPGRRVAWHVLDNYLNFVDDQSEWQDTKMIFDISATDAGTEVRFTHVGLVPEYDCYDVCSNAWGGYISGSLRNLIMTGQGQPNPKEDGSAPAHQAAATVARARLVPQTLGLADLADGRS